MQNKFKILSILFSMILSISSFSNEIKSSDEAKITADSLFQSKKYVDAKLIYDELFFTQNVKSDDLLLKLSFINEGLKKYEWTLYFLEKYLSSHPRDEKTISKIQKIADDQKLTGYSTTDSDLFLSYAYIYQFQICTFLALILIIVFVLNYIKKNKLMLTLFILGSFILISSFLLQKQQSTIYGIINSKSLIMDQPSAAGKLEEQVKPGHKVIILDSVDIWSKILINNKEVYIKTVNISKI